MAMRMEPLPLARCSFPSRILFRFAFLTCLSFLIFLIIALSPASAQTSSQQYVFSGSVFTKDSQTGALTLVPGSSVPVGGIIDPLGRFFFGANDTGVFMYQFDPASATAPQVAGSPFVVAPIQPIWFPPCQVLSVVATEQFVFVSYKFANCGDYKGGLPGMGAVLSFAIDTTGAGPVLRPVASVFPRGSPIQLLTDSKGLHLYVGMGPANDGTQASGPEVYYIDGVGNLFFESTADNPENFGFEFTIDPQDHFVFAIGGLAGPFHIASCMISPVDGTLSTCGGGAWPRLLGMFVEGSGHFLYLPDNAIPNGAEDVYSIDQASGFLTQVGSIPGLIWSKGCPVSDPMGPYVYSADATGLHGYHVDAQTGNLLEIPGSPFSSAGFCPLITGSPVQAISGPAATIFPSTASFGAVVGTTSSAQVFSIVNVGNQLLSISSISVGGTDASSFSQTNTCPAALSPNAHCSVSISFTPATAGTFSASLQVADNAPGSPQTLALNGTGIPLTSGIVFSPSVLSFPSLPLAAVFVGDSSAPQTVTVISSGTAPLHLAGVSLAATNPSDFSFTNNCTAPVAPGSSCTVSLVFSPIAPGQRTANLLLSDDAPGSPQIVSLSGTAVSAVSGGAATGGSTTATVSAGQTAQYQLQLTPAPGFTGTVSLTCSGAPLNAVCQVPASVTLANGVATPFNATVTTSGPALLPPSTPLRLPPVTRVPLFAPLSLALVLSLFVVFWKNRGIFETASGRNHYLLGGVLSAVALCAMLSLSGCGGGSAAVTPPPPLVTPSGTSTLTITLGATSSTGQPLQLQPIQLALTVN